MLRLAEGEMPSITSGEKMRGNDTVPLSLACRTVAKAASRLAVDPGSNETEVQVCGWMLVRHHFEKHAAQV